jgi:hypothetical protein
MQTLLTDRNLSRKADVTYFTHRGILPRMGMVFSGLLIDWRITMSKNNAVNKEHPVDESKPVSVGGSTWTWDDTLAKADGYYPGDCHG